MKTKIKISIILVVSILMQFANAYAVNYFEDIDAMMDSIFTYDLSGFGTEDFQEEYDEYERETRIVCSLGLMSEKENEGFNGKDSLDNADFYRTISILKSNSDYVSENIIDGKVTFRQAIKAMISILGYDNESMMYQDEDSWLLSSASGFGLTKNLDVTLDKQIQRREFARLLVNSFEVDISKLTEVTAASVQFSSQDGVNILMDKLNIYKIKGCLNAVPGINIYAEKTPNEGEIEIDRTRIKVGNCVDAQDMLGANVIAYVKVDKETDTTTLLYCEENSKKMSVHMNISDVDRFTGGYLYYLKDNKESKVKLSAIKYIVYNGDMTDDISILNNIDDMAGSISVCSSSADVYDVIIIKDYSTYLVSSVDAYENRIKFAYNAKYDDSEYISINERENVVMKLDGVRVDDISLITLKSVVSILQNKNKTYTEILISKKTVSGKVDSYDSSERSAIIGDKTIKVDKNYLTAVKEKPGEAKNIQAGSEGTFYVSSTGYIAGFMDADSYIHGYLKKAYVSEDEETVYLKAFIETGEWEMLSLNETIKLDGVKTEAVNFVDYYKNNNLQNTIFAYKVNGDKLIKEIDTIVKGENENAETSMRFVGEAEGETNHMGLWAFAGSKYRANGDTVIFSIPVKEEEEDRYSIINYNVKKETEYRVKYYNTDEFFIAEYAVCTTLDGVDDLDIDSRELTIVTGVGGAYINDEMCYKINAIRVKGVYSGVGTAQEVEIYADEDIMEEHQFQKGCMYVVSTDKNGFIKGAQKLFDVSKRKEFVTETHSSMATIYQFGTVKYVDSASRMMLISSDGDESSWASGVVVVYETAKGKARIASMDDVYSGEQVFIFGSCGNTHATVVVR